MEKLKHSACYLKALSLKAASIVFAVVALYLQDLTIVFSDALHSESSSYILAIPFMFAYLIYRKRRMLQAAASFREGDAPRYLKRMPVPLPMPMPLVLGTLLCAFALALYCYGSYTFTPLEYRMLGLPFFLAGLTVIVFNARTLRHAAFPIAFLAFLTPPPLEALYALGSSLSILGSETSYGILKALGIPATLSSDYGSPVIIIKRPDATEIRFLVDIACSGVYSLIGFTVFSTFLAYVVGEGISRKGLVFLIGMPLIYTLNIMRITLIPLIGYGFGEELAIQVFHFMGGWLLIFLGAIMLITVLENLKVKVRGKAFAEEALGPCPLCSLGSPGSDSEEAFCPYCGRPLKDRSPRPRMGLKRRDLAKIAAILTAVLLTNLIQVPVFALTEAPEELKLIIHTPTGEHGNLKILPPIQGYDLEFAYRDRDFERRAKQDASLVYTYVPLEGQGGSWIFVALEVASWRSSLHSWEHCLIGWPLSRGYQPSVAQLELKDLKLFENPPVTARYFAFQYLKTGQVQLVLYWYEAAIFAVNRTFQQKPVKISLIAYPDSLEELPDMEGLMARMARAIVEYWRPVKTWSPVLLALAKNGQILTATVGLLASSVLVIQKIIGLREKKLNLRLYNKMAEEERILIKAVSESDRVGIPTGKAILECYQRLLGRPADLNIKILVEKLYQAEKAGLVKRDIASVYDLPSLVWRSLV